MIHLPLVQSLSTADWLGLGWFAASWFGFAYLIEGSLRRKTLLAAGHRYRLMWARQMLTRENRIVDVALVTNLLHSVSFYANTSIYIIAGMLAILGALDQFMTAAGQLPFSGVSNKEVLEIKLLLLMSIFVYAYFKFTWALREFNVLSIVMGSVPPQGSDPVELEAAAQRTAAVNTCAGDDFNRGIRAYYFGMAVMAWMLSPWAFMIATTMIVAVLTRRECASPILKALD